MSAFPLLPGKTQHIYAVRMERRGTLRGRRAVCSHSNECSMVGELIVRAVTENHLQWMKKNHCWISTRGLEEQYVNWILRCCALWVEIPGLFWIWYGRFKFILWSEETLRRWECNLDSKRETFNYLYLYWDVHPCPQINIRVKPQSDI